MYFFENNNTAGIHLDPDKVMAIQQLKAPTNVTEFRRFLGMVTYLACDFKLVYSYTITMVTNGKVPPPRHPCLCLCKLCTFPVGNSFVRLYACISNPYLAVNI